MFKQIAKASTESAYDAALNGLSMAKSAVSSPTVQQGLSAVADKSGNTVAWVAENKGTAVAVAVAGVGITAIAAPAVFAGATLGAAGFGQAGVTAGSVAATAQSYLGSVAAGSVFSTLQSAGAGGPGVVAVNSVVQGAGAVVAGTVGGIISWSKSKM